MRCGFLPIGLAVSLLTGCITEPGPEIPLDDGLRRYGTVTHHQPPPDEGGLSWLRVVIIRDRHYVHGAITRIRGPLYQIQRENRGAIGFMIIKGFRLLGCEAALGPLPTAGDAAAAHRSAVREALNQHDNLHSLTVYQPIRYEEEFRGVLDVVGMEDTKLYESDAGRLADVIRLRRIATRSDNPRSMRSRAVEEMVALLGTITSNVHARGRAAACNLIEHMLCNGVNNAMMMLGGAHTDAAVELLRAEGVDVRVFECRSYQRR
jgi:hypothetical protein